MIREVFIFRHNTGELLFGHSTSEHWESIDKNLVTSFLSALFQFSKELGEGNIRSLIMSDSVSHYKSWEDVTFTLVTTLDYDPEIVSYILEEIKTRFLNRFYGIIKGWDGSIETFTKFSEVVKQSLYELDKRNKILNVLPHSILDSNEQISILPKDAEIASMFALAEKNKKKSFFGRSKEEIITFSKLLVPLFIEPMQDWFLLIDGLGLCHSKIRVEPNPNFASLAKQLYVTDSADINLVLEEIRDKLKVEVEEAELNSIVDTKLLEPSLLDSVYETVTEFAHIVVPFLSNEELLQKKVQFMNRKQEIQQTISAYNEIIELIISCGENAKTELEATYEKTRISYNNNLELLEAQIRYNLGLIDREHDSKKSQILHTYDEKQKIIQFELQSITERFSELFRNISDNIDLVVTKKQQNGSPKDQTEAYIEDLSQLLDNMVGDTQLLQERYHGLKSLVQMKNTELNQLELACNEECNLLKQEFHYQSRAEKNNLTTLEDEKTNKLTKIRQSIDEVETNVKLTLHLIENKITKLQEHDYELNRYLCKDAGRLQTIDKIYIPFYLIQ